MRVLIDTTYVRRAPLSGTGVYVTRLIEELERMPEVEVRVAANDRRRAPAGGGLGSIRNAAGDLWWANVGLPKAAREQHADVIHHPLPAHARVSTPQVITVHDLAFERRPLDFDRAFRIYAHRAHRSAARSAAAVIAVSQTTAADVRQLWGVPPPRIVVAHHGPGQDLPKAPPGQPRHFLYVGDEEPRKDLATLLSAYSRYRSQFPGEPLALVLAGATTGRDQAGVRTEQRPTPERLAELYANAGALVHPSRYEGFGLTPLEAMSLGVPVIAARAPGVIEVCDGAACLYRPGDLDGLARALGELAAEPELRERLGAAGRARAAAFSWVRSAERHLDAYSLAIDGRPHAARP